MKTPKKLIIRRGGVDYVPLRAVPVITDGFFSEIELARMIGYPDGYCDPAHAEILTAYALDSDEGVRPLDHEYFARLADGYDVSPARPGLTALRALPAGAVVRLDTLRAKFTAITTGISQSRYFTRLGSVPCWDLDRPVASALKAVVTEGFEATQFVECSRIKDRGKQIREIKRLVDKVSSWATRHGRPFDPNAMPGTRKQFIEAIRHAAPALERAEMTLHDHLKEAGLRWPQGARPMEPYWPAEALGGQPQRGTSGGSG